MDRGTGPLQILETLHPPEARTVRLDYRRGEGRRRFVLCRFSPPEAGLGRQDLDRVATDAGPLTGAALYLLKRYYLDTPEAAAEAPARPAPDLARLPAPVAYGAQQFLSGLPRLGIYALLAAAYALTFGLVGRINLAFGELAAIGAAAAGLGVAALSGGTGPLALALGGGLVLATAAGGLHGFVAGTAAFRLVPARAGQASLVATIGIALALTEYLRQAGGPRATWIPPLGGLPAEIARAGDFTLTLTAATLATAGAGLVAAAALVFLMRRSGFGRAWRASADDPLAAALCGIDPARLSWTTFALSGALAGLAGALVALQYGSLGYAGGFALGLKALTAAVLGGVGSVGGAVLGGLAIGLFETLWSAYLPIDGRDLALHVLLVLLIVLGPERSSMIPTSGARTP